LALAESEAIGNPSLHSYVACRLAELLVTRGELGEASRLLDAADRNPTPLLGPRRVAIRARLRATAGDESAAADVQQFLGMVSDGHLAQKTDLTIEAAEIMDLLGDRVAARTRAGEALRMAEAKENWALAAQVRTLLARLGA
jgi:ATP/maltotriose-dependent transcriptional regulator MalT